MDKTYSFMVGFRHSSIGGSNDLFCAADHQYSTTGQQKPEMSAPGTAINTVAGQGNPGTSYAAPQVAGVAALLMHRSPTLKDLPWSVKAILMASAVHNLEGNRNLSDVDGAGGINASLADQIAQTPGGLSACSAPCWWDIPVQDTNSAATDTYLPKGNYLYRYFNAIRGERIRVAISWHSTASSDGNQDGLNTSLNLYVDRPNGSLAASSGLVNNSMEIAEFVAQESGQFRIRVFRIDNGLSESSNKLGIAWTKQATYLPDVRNSGGWASTIYVRNDGAEPRDVTISYFDTSGSSPVPASTTIPSLPPNAVATPGALPSGFSGSAIVDGREDLSVVVETVYDSGGRYMAYSYPGETQPGLNLYAPLVLRRWPTLQANWKQTTELVLLNTSNQDANVTVEYYDSWPNGSGSSIHSVSRIILANRQLVVSATEMPFWESMSGQSASLAAVRITSNRPLAAVTRNLIGSADGTGTITTPYLAGSHRFFTSGANLVYAPVTGKQYAGYDSSLQVQNLSSGTTTFTIRYYALNQGAPVLTLSGQMVGGYRSLNFWRPNGLSVGYFGSAVVEVTAGGPLAVMGQWDKFDTTNNRYDLSQYEGVYTGNQSQSMAHIQKTAPWSYTGIQAQNLLGAAQTIPLQYYEMAGGTAGSASKSNVPSQAAVNFWAIPSEIPSFNGSGVANSAPVAIVVNFDRSGDTGFTNKDTMMGYSSVK